MNPSHENAIQRCLLKPFHKKENFESPTHQTHPYSPHTFLFKPEIYSLRWFCMKPNMTACKAVLNEVNDNLTQQVLSLKIASSHAIKIAYLLSYNK